jgi:hypothetical protein
MGIGPLEFEFMLWEHKYRPITGEVLTIGKPAVALSSQGVADVLSFCGVPQISSDLELDTTNLTFRKTLNV